jgi:phage baseplate assembly protein W
MTKAFAIEDGNQGSASIAVAKTRLYKDIDLTFSVKASGEIYKKIDAAAVRQALKNLILTNRYEKPFQPNFGGDLTSLMFEMNTSLTGYRIRDRIISQIETYEPRAKIRKLITTPMVDTNDLMVYLEAVVQNESRTIVTIETPVSRLR